ncbi:hypothetical protein LX64_03211 [Chitinophaga skermanii]|uniref:Type IX secretion system PorP/SprF family membrane protein n=1 Tax=Chitinophaga skermanii TaxID=331697 RepID=A0A327QF05_9BACT|nr:type IX secretion system protein PorQ [Chitinophaga skermanii]RAJ02202.1 hypothetical protein LX64_03211 [Chitinophaga skermanii]
MPLYRLLFCLLFCSIQAGGQQLGGAQTFSFLQLPTSAHLTALGGTATAWQSNDIAFGIQNPALLRPSMHTHLQVNYADYFAGVKYTNLATAFYFDHIATTFATSLQYIHYGQMAYTDETGQVNGQFAPVDFAWQVSAGRQYLSRWYYGASLKFIQSKYQEFTSNGFAVDVGLSYIDTANGLQVSVVAKNMGTQLKKAGSSSEPMPFDLQAGISKRLAHVPLQVSASFRKLYKFDSAVKSTQGEESLQTGTFDRVMQHIVLASGLTIAKYVAVDVAYNHQQRVELATMQQKGLSGFSLGVGILLQKMQLYYGRAMYQRNQAYNHIGINIPMHRWMSFGKFGRSGS